MKNRFYNLVMWYLIGGLIVCLLLIPEILIAKKITSNDTDFFKAFLIMSLVTLFIYLVIVGVKFILYRKYYNAEQGRRLQDVKNELTSEFKPVILECSEDVPKEKFECQAKVDENGKIICKIYVDYQTQLDSYEEFLKYFHLNKE